MDHENLNRKIGTQGSSDRSFGLVFSAFFLIIAVLPLFDGGRMRLWASIVSGLFLAASFVAPGILSPLNRLWTRFGLLLHKIVGPVVLGVMFYAMVTPMGILRRLFGNDPMRLRLEPALKSYWIKREPPGPKPESMTDQF